MSITYITKRLRKANPISRNKNLGLDENEFDLSNSVTDQPKNWIDGQTYNYDFYVSHY